MVSDWKDKKVAILGVGIEGISSARFLVERGARVTFLDRKEDIRKMLNDKWLMQNEKGVGFVGGDEYLSGLDKYDVIVRSPGVRVTLPELEEAKRRGVTITSQIKLFFDLCPCPIVGVTGTKGKGTTSTLIYEMLKKSGKDAHLGGNIGKPPLDFLDILSPQSIVVLELSSFQLQDLEKSPHIGVILMVTSEHLDVHADVREYVEAKRNLIRFQGKDDLAVINRDYPASNESDILTEGKVYYVSRERVVENGCYVDEGAVWLRRDGVASNAISTKEATSDVASISNIYKKIIDLKDIRIPGRHNWENVCAAVMAASLAGVEKDDMVAVLKSFTGLEHRLELVREVRGIRYYDDSFSTTPETAIAGIEAFSAPEVLILGGSSKGSDFEELGRVIGNAKNIRAIIGIGDEWGEIRSKIQDQKSKILILEGAKDMKTIVGAAAKIAQEGDVVLLSPGCASFGMFRNYKDRGEQFKREVTSL